MNYRYVIDKKDDNHGGINSYYCWFKNNNLLMNNEINQDNHNYICRRCPFHFRIKSKYERHIKECSKNKPVKFNDLKKSMYTLKMFKISKSSYVIYANFESIIKNMIQSVMIQMNYD